MRGWNCLRAGLMMALPASGVFWLLVRRGAPLNLPMLGATLGTVAGLVGVAVLQFHCDLQNWGHLMAWHGARVRSPAQLRQG